MATASASLLARVSTLPGWATVGALVAVSWLGRALLARHAVAPWIMPDEIVYSGLARSFAETGQFQIRGHVTSAYGFVYPLLLSPAYVLFGAVPKAYTAAKTINALLMSLAAFPVYVLARRVVSVRGALIATVLTLLLPAMGYTATLMTENAFLPLFCLTALALVRALERPTLGRQAVVIALVVVDFLTRAQALAFLPAILLAPLLYALFAGHAAQLRRYLPLGAALGGGALLVVGAQVARGRSPDDLLGAYAVTGRTDYPLGTIAKWTVYHVGVVDLGLALAPLFALVLLVAGVRRLDLPLQAFLAATLALSSFLLVEVAAFAVTQAGRIEERNLFYVEPLLLIALVAWLERGMPRPPRVAIPAAAILAVLPALIPFARLLGPPTESDTQTLVVWWYLQHTFFALDHTWVVVLVAGIAVAALLLFLPARLWALVPALLALQLVLSFRVIEGWQPWGTRGASIGALYQGITADHPDWIDRKLGRDAEVAYLWNGSGAFTVWQTEFFNRSVRRFYDVETPVTPAGQFETLLRVGAHGWLLDDGKPVRERYVVAHGSDLVAGRRVGYDAGHDVGLYRVSGPLRVRARAFGVDGDTWAGKLARYDVYDCKTGTLRVKASSDPKLFRRPQAVTVFENGARVAAFNLDPTLPETDWALPLRPAGGECRFTFRVGRTAVPAEVVRGSTDTRRLGIRLLGFATQR